MSKVLAKWDFNGLNETQLSFKTGDILEVVLQDINAPGWWLGRHGGNEGVFPNNYVSVIEELRKKKKTYRISQKRVSSKIKNIREKLAMTSVSFAGLLSQEITNDRKESSPAAAPEPSKERLVATVARRKIAQGNSRANVTSLFEGSMEEVEQEIKKNLASSPAMTQPTSLNNQPSSEDAQLSGQMAEAEPFVFDLDALSEAEAELRATSPPSPLITKSEMDASPPSPLITRSEMDALPPSPLVTKSEPVRTLPIPMLEEIEVGVLGSSPSPNVASPLHSHWNLSSLQCPSSWAIQYASKKKELQRVPECRLLSYHLTRIQLELWIPCR